MKRRWNGEPLPGRLVGGRVHYASLTFLPPPTMKEARKLASLCAS
jgi:hypothetical protein